MRTAEQVTAQYNNYLLKSVGEEFQSMKYFYNGAVYALGFTLQKTLPEIEKDFARVKREYDRKRRYE